MTSRIFPFLNHANEQYEIESSRILQLVANP
jgi:hypothetical protein